jgi:hypothetical protein
MCPVLRTRKYSAVLRNSDATATAGWPIRETPTVKAPTNGAGGPETPFTLYTGRYFTARVEPPASDSTACWVSLDGLDSWMHAISQPTQVQYLQYPT